MPCEHSPGRRSCCFNVIKLPSLCVALDTSGAPRVQITAGQTIILDKEISSMISPQYLFLKKRLGNYLFDPTHSYQRSNLILACLMIAGLSGSPVCVGVPLVPLTSFCAEINLTPGQLCFKVYLRIVFTNLGLPKKCISL